MPKPGKLLNWIPAILWASLIFFQSSNPSPAGAELAPDYLLHFAAFAVLAFFLAMALAGGAGNLAKKGLGRGQALFALVISALYGCSDEFHQSFVPGRNSSWADVAADFLGAAFVLSLLSASSHLAGKVKFKSGDM